MFNVAFGLPQYKATMAEVRFNFLPRALRFDDISAGEESVNMDRLAAIKELWNQFVEKCEPCCYPGDTLTIDEKLLPFRSRCPFRIYI